MVAHAALVSSLWKKSIVVC